MKADQNADEGQLGNRRATEVATPYYADDLVTLYHGDARSVLMDLLSYDDWTDAALITDPPYPNRAGHFTEGIEAARVVCATATAGHWLVFWDEMGCPPVPLPLVARHVWHRTNTNRPDNYEAIYEFHRDGKKRPSRVFPYAVIAQGLTGCHEATEHPTQKNVKLMHRLVQMSTGLVVDPFAGSGTTLRAAKNLGRRAIGIEVNERYCEIAASRLAQDVLDFGEAS